MSDLWVMPQSEPSQDYETCDHTDENGREVRFAKGDAPEQNCTKCLQAWNRREHELMEGREPEAMEKQG